MTIGFQNPSLEEVLSNVSSHLDHLAERIYEIEEALGNSLASDQTETPSIRKLQSLDFVRQSLEDCALLAHFLSSIAPGNRPSQIDVNEVSDKLKLGATRLLLSPKNYDTVSEKRKSMRGDFDLF